MLLTKNSILLTKRSSQIKGWVMSNDKIEVKKVIMKLANNYNHYDKSRKLDKVLLEDLDPEFNLKEKESQRQKL